MMDYMINNLQTFVLECGRTMEYYKATTRTHSTPTKSHSRKLGSMTVRHSPAYNSNSQGNDYTEHYLAKHAP